jgi:tyrosyl-tRNA synthetase
VADGDQMWIGKALALAGLSKSSTEGARLVRGGAVHIDGEPLKDEQLRLGKGNRYLVRVGTKNRRFVYLTVG